MKAITDFNWEIKDHGALLGEAMETGFASDITLFLGYESDEVKCHRSILSIFSPKLHSMMVDGENLVLENVEVYNFNSLLKYCYTGQCGVEMYNAIPLLDLAIEYQIAGLIEQCDKILKGDIPLSKALKIFSNALISKHKKPLKPCLELICRNGSIITTDAYFSWLDQKCVEEIVKQDTLIVQSEVDVFNAVCRWAEIEVERWDLDPCPENVRKVWGEILYLIRFSQMTPLDFSRIVVPENILSQEEVISFFVYFADPDRAIPPKKFISTKRSSAPEVMALQTSAPEVLAPQTSAPEVLAPQTSAPATFSGFGNSTTMLAASTTLPNKKPMVSVSGAPSKQFGQQAAAQTGFWFNMKP